MHTTPPTTNHTVLPLTVAPAMRERTCCGQEMTFEPLLGRPVCYTCGKKG